MKRAEDPRFVAGQGNYVTDMAVDGALWAVFVRSTVAHGTITSIDTSAASAMPGVVAVLTADDLPESMPAVVRSLDEVTRRPLSPATGCVVATRWRSWWRERERSTPPAVLGRIRRPPAVFRSTPHWQMEQSCCIRRSAPMSWRGGFGQRTFSPAPTWS